MKIAILTHGGNFFGRHYAQAFKQRGHDVHMLLLMPPEHELPDVSVHLVGPPGFDPDSTSRCWYLKAVMPVRRAVRELRPDVLLALYVSSAGVLGGLSGHRRLVISARGSDITGHIDSRLWRSIFRWLGRRAVIVHAVSDELAEMLGDRAGVAPDKLLVCPIGVDTQALAYVEPSARPGAGRIICTRAHSQVYNQATFIRALGILRDRGVSFHVTFGSDHEADKTRALVEQAGLAGHIEFVGGYSLAELPGLLSRADVYESSSLSDGTSSSLLEAMSTGLFPVVSDIPANRPWITHGHNGLLFAVGDAEALATQLAEALANAELRASAAQRNRRIILEKGDQEIQMDKLLAAIQARFGE